MTHETLIADGPKDDSFAAAVLDGLSRPEKTLPCRFIYDRAGSELFERITALPEYYPTRTEIGILESCAAEIVARTPAGTVLIEFGSGSSRKTEILLRALDRLAAYVPLDVSAAALEDASRRLHRRFPGLRVIPLVGDFRTPPRLPDDLADRPRLGFFPGSTIGNFAPDEAVLLLRSMAEALGRDGRLVIGVDLLKGAEVLIPAYDDAAGVTAAFNLNLLARANRDLGADFDLAAFRHEARFNEERGRIEMHLVSVREQVVRVLGQSFSFAAGESIHTESSHKYTSEGFRTLAARAGWTARRMWSDAAGLFSVHELSAGSVPRSSAVTSPPRLITS